MLAFRVALNGKTLATAGIAGPHVLSTIVTSVVRGPRAPGTSSGDRPLAHDLDLTLGALDSTAQEHVSWINSALQVGDQVVIEVIDVERVDAPLRRRGKTAAPEEQREEARGTRTKRLARSRTKKRAAAQPTKKRSAAQPTKKRPAARPTQPRLAGGATAAPLGKRKQRP